MLVEILKDLEVKTRTASRTWLDKFALHDGVEYLFALPLRATPPPALHLGG